MTHRTAVVLLAALAAAAREPPDHPGRPHRVTVSHWVDPFIGGTFTVRALLDAGARRAEARRP